MLTLDFIHKALQDLADEVKAEILRRLRSPIGVNPSVGENTLIGSNLETSIELYPNETSDGLVFEIADYFSYVTHGRKHGMKPPEAGTKKSILEWVHKKHIELGDITDENKVAKLVYYSLKYKKDIPARPFIGYDYKDNKDAFEVVDFFEDYVDKWADELFEKITKEIDKHFEK